MKKFSLYFVLFLVAALVSTAVFSAEKRIPPINPGDAGRVIQSGRAEHPWPAPNGDITKFQGGSSLSRPTFKSFAEQRAGAGSPRPESLCDPGYYWMGGEASTSDTNGTAYVWGAGGNLYFAGASDPTHPVEIWLGDIPLRIRVHNNRAYCFCYFNTLIFDVSDPLSPSFLYQAPGFYYQINDAVPTPDDNFLILTDLSSGDGYVWDIVSNEMKWIFSSPMGGTYIPMCIPEDPVSQGNTLILGDFANSYYDFWDISDLQCGPPVFIGHILNATPSSPSGAYDVGNIFYKYPFLYGNYEPWQYYNPWVGAFFYGPSYDEQCWLSVYHIPDISRPENNLFLKEFIAPYDIVSIKDPGSEGMAVAYLQNRTAQYDAQFNTVIKAGYFGTQHFDWSADKVLYDFGVHTAGGLVSEGARGLRFFNDFFSETCHFTTGSYASGIVGSGNWLFIPSGGAGLAILDNSDPSNPVTASFVETDSCFDSIAYATVSTDGNYLFVSDGSANIWTVNVTDKYHPVVMNCASPYFTSGTRAVYSLAFAGGRLVVGTSATLELVDVSNPEVPVRLDSRTLSGNCRSIKAFEHPAYPGSTFIGAVSPANFYTYRISGGIFTDTGTLGGFSNLYDLSFVGDKVYLIDTSATIRPIRMTPQSPSVYFSLSTSGTTPLSLGYSSGQTYIAKVSDSFLAASGDSPTTGYPAVFLVSIEDPLAPALMPAGQPGIMPMDGLTGLGVHNSMVYYALDLFGIGALQNKPDYDMPQVVDPPGITVNPIYYNNGSGVYYIQQTVDLSVSVTDPTSAITSVIFEFYDGSSWRRIAQKTISTPAGQVGTYTHLWNTGLWQYGTGNGPIRIRVEDSGCNETIFVTPASYHINTAPSFDIAWDPGCNAMPGGELCVPAGSWIVSGNLCFTISAYTNPFNIVSDGSPDDVSQIAYAIDGGPWTLVDIPTGGPNPLPVCIDTTPLSDGAHTLTVRITDDCTLQGFKDSLGTSSWTFTVHNDGPGLNITSPLSGNSVSGSAVHVAAAITGELPSRPVNIVRFYVDPSDLSDPLTGTLIGTATTKDINGEFSITWDTTGFPYGNHIMIAAAWENSDCAGGPFDSPFIFFSVIPPDVVPPEIARGTSETDAQIWSNDKTMQGWPFEYNATGYKLYRGTQAQLAGLRDGTGDSCVRYDGPTMNVDLSADDPSIVPGRFYWYLVTARNGSLEGSAGRGSDVIERTVDPDGSCQ